MRNKKDYNTPFTKNLENVQGTYTNALIQHNDELAKAADDRSVDTETFRQMILDAVKDAKDTAACRDFRYNVNTIKSKSQLIFYVWNALYKGQGYSMKNLNRY